MESVSPFYYTHFLSEIYTVLKDDDIKKYQAIAFSATFLSRNLLRVQVIGCGDLFELKKPQMRATFKSTFFQETARA